MSYITRMNVQPEEANLNESCHTYECAARRGIGKWVTSHVWICARKGKCKESCHTCECAARRGERKWVTSHIFVNELHHTYANVNELCHVTVCKWICKESCHTSLHIQRVMSYEPCLYLLSHEHDSFHIRSFTYSQLVWHHFTHSHDSLNIYSHHFTYSHGNM